MSSAPANGGEDIYLSEDGRISWTLTNSSGLYAHANPWVQSLFAVDDYVFASIQPEFANIQNAPPFIVSSTQTPNFSAGDVTGLPTGQTNSHLPFFFNSRNKLFTMFWDVYVSQPGFSGTTAVSELGKQNALKVYPNPVSDKLIVEVNNLKNTSVQIVTIYGQLLKNIPLYNPTTSLSVDDLQRGIYFVNQTTADGTLVKKIVKD